MYSGVYRLTDARWPPPGRVLLLSEAVPYLLKCVILSVNQCWLENEMSTDAAAKYWALFLGRLPPFLDFLNRKRLQWNSEEFKVLHIVSLCLI